MPIRSFTELEVWKLAHTVNVAVLRMSGGLPSIARYDIISQMRRASLSIPANIVEGFGRPHPREKIRFYSISMGSARELEYYLILCRDLGYMPADSELPAQLLSVIRMLNALMSSIRNAAGLSGPS